MNFLRIRFPLLLIVLCILSGGCSTTEKGTEKRGPFLEDTMAVSYDDLTSLDFLLYMSRSSLSDLHSSQQHDMPAAFLTKEAGKERINDDPFDGYRIQIISTRNIELADSIANDFRIWADTSITGYTPHSYTFFSQPYYKVHVGDFQEQERARTFTRLIKDKYPAAWVVHDRIDPRYVPADTATIRVVPLKEGFKKTEADTSGS